MDAIRNLMFDVASGREIYDEEQGRVMTKAECDDAIRRVCFEKLGLDEKSTERDIKRALKRDSAHELFQIIEEIVDVQVAKYWRDNEFFNDFVETKSLADGDANEFWTQEEIFLNVAKVAGDHHDLIMQKLNEGESYTVPTSYYAVKVGTDIRLFLTGRKNWSDFVGAVAKAFARKIQAELYSEFMNGSNLLPVPSKLTGTGALSTSTKSAFDDIITAVEAANEAPVVILGTKSALKQINNLVVAGGVDWIADSQKEEMAANGVLGHYEGTALIEIPQRFEDNTLAKELVDPKALLIMPLVDNKPVKFVDYGETSLEVTEVGATMNDQQSYEVQRRMGVSTLMTRYHGMWSLA